MFTHRFDPLWRKVRAKLERVAVRVVFVGPDSEPDPRIERAKEAGKAKPMDPAFFEAVKEFLVLAEEKSHQWSEVIKPRADKAMAALWERLWKTPEGKRYQVMKADVERRKTQVDAVCRRAEDGISKKILAGGQTVTYIKANVLVGREEMLEEARREVERLKGQLADAKQRLSQLEKGKRDSIERINLLIVEQGASPKSSGMAGDLRLSDSEPGVEEVLVADTEIDGLIGDELEAIDGIVGELRGRLEMLASEGISEEELEGLSPSLDDETVRSSARM